MHICRSQRLHQSDVRIRARRSRHLRSVFGLGLQRAGLYAPDELFGKHLCDPVQCLQRLDLGHISGTRLTSTSTSYRAPSCFRKSGASDSFQFWCTRPHYEAETSTAYWGLQSYHTFYVPSQNGGGDYREMIMMTPPNKGLGDSLTAAVLALYGRSVSRMTFAAQSCVLMADPYVSSMDAVVVCPKGKRNNNGELGWNSNGLPASTEGITTDDTVFIGLCLQFALHHFDVPEEKAFAIGFVSCRRFSNPLPGHTHRKTDPERFSAPR